jgi:hypothetical protein
LLLHIYIPLVATSTIRALALALPISIDEKIEAVQDITFDELIIASLTSVVVYLRRQPRHHNDTLGFHNKTISHPGGVGEQL